MYRYDPRKEQPLTIDTKKPADYSKMKDFMLKEARYAQLVKLKGPEFAEKMFAKAEADAKRRHARLEAIRDNNM